MSHDSGEPAVLPSSFAGLLRRYRQRAGLSQSRLARLAGIDPAYVNRMELSGPAAPLVPRAPILAGLAAALGISAMEQDRLYFAAGRLPPTLERIGRWDPAMQTLAELLLAPGLAEDDLVEFRLVLAAQAERWRRSIERT